MVLQPFLICNLIFNPRRALIYTLFRSWKRQAVQDVVNKSWLGQDREERIFMDDLNKRAIFNSRYLSDDRAKET